MEPPRWLSSRSPARTTDAAAPVPLSADACAPRAGADGSGNSAMASATDWSSVRRIHSGGASHERGRGAHSPPLAEPFAALSTAPATPPPKLQGGAAAEGGWARLQARAEERK